LLLQGERLCVDGDGPPSVPTREPPCEGAVGDPGAVRRLDFVSEAAEPDAIAAHPADDAVHVDQVELSRRRQSDTTR
jgi:hypothetical protein